MSGAKIWKDDIIQDLQQELSTFYLTFFRLNGGKTTFDVMANKMEMQNL